MKTAYCTECEGPSDVIDESIEDDWHLGWATRAFWVRRLDCGHEDVTEREDPHGP